MEASSYVTEAEQDKFSGLGAIECPYPGEPPTSTRRYVSTGWLAEGSDTVVTVSHAFYKAASPPQMATETHFPPITCGFVTYDRWGKLRDSVPIAYARVKWDDPLYHSDRTDDQAVVKLARRPSHAIRWLPLGDGKDLNDSNIMLVSFSNDVPDPTRPRKSRGKIFKMPLNGVHDRGGTHGYRLLDNRRIFATSVDSSYGSSGGLYIDDTGAIIGLHRGCVMKDGSCRPSNFDLSGPSYNAGIYIDRTFYDEIRLTAENSPP